MRCGAFAFRAVQVVGVAISRAAIDGKKDPGAGLHGFN
jgi:hypothetical protein